MMMTKVVMTMMVIMTTMMTTMMMAMMMTMMMMWSYIAQSLYAIVACSVRSVG